jgi:3' terminal RNA ribose 2'-O-methyltransferase Hen1
MLVEISTTAPNATDLGYLLHKNPANVFERDLPYGKVRVFYTEATDEKCTAVLWLDIDQVGLVRGRNDHSFALSQYVNDRPYVASSYTSVAIGVAFASALAGRSKERPERTLEAWPLTITLPAVDCDAGAEFLNNVFVPLGYVVQAEPLPLDTQFPEWGPSTLYRLTLTAAIRVADTLAHLYVLLPVLDNQKHYAIGADEVVKLLENAGEWLSVHPLRDIITRRYLRYRRHYVEDARAALDRLVEENSDAGNTDAEREEVEQVKEDLLEQPLRLHDQRLSIVEDKLSSAPMGVRTVIDLGCGEGKLLRMLAADPRWQRIVGMDVSTSALKSAARRLHLDRESRSSRLSLLHGSLLYRDDRLKGFDAAALVEVIEHIEPDRLEFVERVLFGFARPGRVVITTPNADYNSHWSTLDPGKFRHSDHRFEWTRDEFDRWTERVSRMFGYSVEHSGIGEIDGELGAPSQLAVFDRL